MAQEPRMLLELCVYVGVCWGVCVHKLQDKSDKEYKCKLKKSYEIHVYFPNRLYCYFNIILLWGPTGKMIFFS